MWKRLIATSAWWMTIPLRLALGAVFIAHGSQKVLGVWGGKGFSNFIAREAPLGLKPAWLWLGLAALWEFFGGIMVLLGLLTRVGAFGIAATMIVAIAGVHWKNGFFAQNEGFEYPFTLLLIALTLLYTGGGRLSADEAMQRR